ncbi:BMC domain-containing protein [Vagococcus intermedius]|uniref:BMC domain-containing protein n=1 Tax=Vagococcus intermedius TaxID=2991418 RepID=A0AAF0CTW0_9ENTE|nr:BMC domain-containing protein [Vagococcus intermedius]WEG72786.1 BMC domain-containing protein [Vagococcus intermedius]WEG74871.1 BMC domain-containing protein [Vagococcus intermedius]
MEDKQRLIQEYVPGKQVSMAHIIASPTADIYDKLGLVNTKQGAIGVLTITPSEAAIIAVDIAVKAGDVEIGFVDRFSGSVVLTGDLSSVESALSEVARGLEELLGFSSTIVTKT